MARQSKLSLVVHLDRLIDCSLDFVLIEQLQIVKGMEG